MSLPSNLYSPGCSNDPVTNRSLRPVSIPSQRPYLRFRLMTHLPGRNTALHTSSVETRLSPGRQFGLLPPAQGFSRRRAFVHSATPAPPPGGAPSLSLLSRALTYTDVFLPRMSRRPPQLARPRAWRCRDPAQGGGGGPGGSPEVQPRAIPRVVRACLYARVRACVVPRRTASGGWHQSLSLMGLTDTEEPFAIRRRRDVCNMSKSLVCRAPVRPCETASLT